MWHLTCGDLAAQSVNQLLGAAISLRVMRDDLAVGPLADISTAPCSMRVAFWQQVWPQSVQPSPNFDPGIADDAQWLAALVEQPQAVTVWHGDSCSEQLLLARVAAALEGSPVALWEVACGTGDSRVATRKAVSMHAPEALAELYQPRRVAPQRLQRLAAQWRVMQATPGSIRRWQNGEFSTEDYRLIDSRLVHFATEQYQPLARVMASVMAECDGFFATDFFLWWRARELAAAGQLKLSLPAAATYAEQQVCLATA